jgi:hypothetical protein
MALATWAMEGLAVAKEAAGGGHGVGFISRVIFLKSISRVFMAYLATSKVVL